MAMNAKKLREQLAAKMDEVAAVNSLCEKENREPTAEEVAIINAAIGEDGKGGEAATLRNRLKQAEAFESELAVMAAARNAIPGGVHHEQAGVEDSQGFFAKVRVPPSAKPRFEITSFEGADKDKQAYAFGMFVLAACGRRKAQQWCARTFDTDIKAGMTEGTDSAGGAFVPDEFEANLIRLVQRYGVFRSQCRRVPMTSDTKTYPRRTGGLTAYFIGETGTPTESTISADQIRLTAKDCGALTYFSSDLDDDSAIEIGNQIMLEMALAFAYKEDVCGFLGDGTSTYGGIVGLKNALSTYGKYTAASGHTAFSTLTIDDFDGMIAALPDYADQNGGPKWYFHKTGWQASAARLATAASGNSQLEIVNGVPTQFFRGYPVVFSNVLNNTTGTQAATGGLCYLGNLSLGVDFGDRKGVSIAMSKEVQFLTRQTAVLGVERFDINVHDKGVSGQVGAVCSLTTP